MSLHRSFARAGQHTLLGLGMTALVGAGLVASGAGAAGCGGSARHDDAATMASTAAGTADALAAYQQRRASGAAPDAAAARRLAIGVIKRGLDDAAPAVRVAAARAAAMAKLDGSLRAHAGDADALVRATIAGALGDVKTLLALADDAADDARATALDALATRAPGAARAAALRHVRDANPAVQAAALAVLGAARDGADGELIAGVLSSAADGHARAIGLRALAALPGAAAVALQIARDGLNDRYPGARLAALGVLDALLGAEAPATLRNVAAGPDASLRVQAAVLLWRRDLHAEARAALLSVVTASGPWTARAAALNAADGMNDKDAGALADAGERDSAPGVRLAAGRLLSDLGARDRALTLWAGLLTTTPDPSEPSTELTYSQIQAAAELARAADPRGPSALDGYAAPGAPLRAAALSALGDIPGAPRDALISALADPAVALTAASAIVRSTR